MDKDTKNKYGANITFYMFLVSGLILVIYCLLFNEYIISWLYSKPRLRPPVIKKIRVSQWYFLITGLWIIFFSIFIGKIRGVARLMNQDIIRNIVLLILSTLLPLFLLEYSLKPFIPVKPATPKTNIFVRDRELGWKLKPGSEDTWGGVKVKINHKGLRGPERTYNKPANVFRILFLGDSVTFGYGLKSYDQTFPSITETSLNTVMNQPVETINAGVGGYSPWQEHLYLVKEGIKYDPDMVIINFVLNDVIEKFNLVRFGGSGVGHQLLHIPDTILDKLEKTCGIIYFGKKLVTRIKFGKDVKKGAKKREITDVKSLVYTPKSSKVQDAWKITLLNLDKIIDFSVDHDMAVILVIFPFKFQFSDVKKSSIPQTVIKTYARKKNIPVIDLLPLLHEDMQKTGNKPEKYFLDMDHLTPYGCRTVAKIITDYVVENKLIR